jgi:hypothetical protein
MAADASIKGAGTFTTHCFRRGGAQYRFMYAPIGEHWSLARIRWWGGWAEGEHVSRTSKNLYLTLISLKQFISVILSLSIF